ncbi:MAG: membrane dipeptidase, partial [Planctomycetota bacterium]
AHHLARSFARANDMIASAEALAARHPTRFRLIRNGAELDAARAAGASAGILGIEGGHALEESLAKLELLWARGLRVLTLVWNNHLAWIRSCQPGAGAHVPPGLSAFGRDVVRRMDELGIVIDLSHAGERSFFDTLETTRQPVIASHSGCMALHAHPRNLTDDQLRALAANGGVCGIVFHPGFLDADARAEEARVRKLPAYLACDEPEPMARFLAQQQVMRREARPLPAERLVEHVLHAIEVAGIDHVGLGSDYDGIERAPAGLEDARGYAVLAELLAQRGLSDGDLLRVLGGNMERVFRRVTDR